MRMTPFSINRIYDEIKTNSGQITPKHQDLALRPWSGTRLTRGATQLDLVAPAPGFA